MSLCRDPATLPEHKLASVCGRRTARKHRLAESQTRTKRDGKALNPKPNLPPPRLKI